MYMNKTKCRYEINTFKKGHFGIKMIANKTFYILFIKMNSFFFQLFHRLLVQLDILYNLCHLILNTSLGFLVIPVKL